MHTLILLATDPAIPTQPGLRPGLTPDQITPGLLGFVATFGIVVIMVFLIRDMVKRIRRVRYRAQVNEQRSGGTHGPDAEYMGIPIAPDHAGEPLPARTPDSGAEAAPGTDEAPADGPAASPEKK
ncbi:hypothetical protein [Arthrobacter sp. H35-D1]|uniref:hypothetical protein n=1 Tax=Arthrobacter sp. H35-D1 TaxID=3046202 RepID=UPI0024BAA6B2|nr:hypothetical protein [Arthrobacter sp. H35-D1]MDJ0312423.1 hypothetical protein [Arthrobacter sp. H35-D1]